MNKSQNILGVRKFLYLLFFIFCFFPYVTFVNLGTDMQPYSLIIAFILLFLFRIRFNSTQLTIAFVFLISVIIFIISGITFSSFRSLFNYSSLFFVSYVSLHVLKTERLNFEKILKISILIWFVVGLIQTLYDRTFLTFLISGSRTTENRGVTGLAPEPTFYGIVFIFFLIFLLHAQYKHKKLLIFACIVGIIFLAKSTMAFLFLAILYFVYLLTHGKIKYILLGFLLFWILPVLMLEILPSTRLSYLVSKIIENPRLLVLIDASINDRFFHLFFSLKGWISNYMIPNGYLTWNSYVLSQLPFYSDFVILKSFSKGDRIMSGYGAAFFELGFFAFLIPITLGTLLFSIYENDLKKFFFFFIFVNTIMFSAIPIGFSFFAVYLGFLGYLSSKSQNRFIKFE
jgi:hypothetical protein